MSKQTDQFAATSQAAIEQFQYLAQMSLANVEKFAGMGLEGLGKSEPAQQELRDKGLGP